jgi:hypothetical protein
MVIQLMLERDYDLKNDPRLRSSGIVISAQVSVSSDSVVRNSTVYILEKEKIKNRILFKRGEEVSYINCVHTVVCRLSQDSLDDIDVDEFGSYIPKGEVNIDPEEHFFALCSFVESIAELGILNLMKQSFQSEEQNPITRNFGFNAQMQYQFIKAIRRIDNNLIDDILMEFIDDLLRNTPERWLLKNFLFLDEMYHIREIVRKFKYFDPIFSLFGRLTRSGQFRFVLAYFNEFVWSTDVPYIDGKQMGLNIVFPDFKSMHDEGLFLALIEKMCDLSQEGFLIVDGCCIYVMKVTEREERSIKDDIFNINEEIFLDRHNYIKKGISAVKKHTYDRWPIEVRKFHGKSHSINVIVLELNVVMVLFDRETSLVNYGTSRLHYPQDKRDHRGTL